MAESWPRLVGGDVALDFVNTDLFSRADPETDVLRSVEEFVAWSAHAGVASASSAATDPSPAHDRAFLRDAADTRAAIRNVVEAVVERRDVDPAALATLRSAYSDAVDRAVPTLDDGRLSLSWESASPSGALSELVAAAVDLLRVVPDGRLKACPNCGFVFLDTTKNGSRRWCSMEDCGTQAKMQRYVTKRAEARTRSHAAG